ncbi:prolyl 4-hydroxylase [Fistulifera solaris]|uniref:Prolyl 4-hydroxylase n=1 Tax=Fistulifera solaris TaxID=1519565 RepID=A0A1Z5JIE8_FISSO|nr:prolyl 4-hydroxylase [Fistulifera solaris]|eukprot:GAX13769.1 prolyl 4-hydroxylase [Fistulifera solaris]
MNHQSHDIITESSSSWEDLDPDEFLNHNKTDDGIDKNDKNDDDDEDDVNENDDENDENEEEDNESLTSWTQEFMEHWKQHAFAVLVAIVATVAAHSYKKSPSPAVPVPYSSSSSSSAPTLHLYDDAHEHLHEYTRTANITFCDPFDSSKDSSSSSSSSSSSLKVMEFHISNEFLPALHAHYAADVWQDVNYSRVLTFLEQLPSHLQIKSSSTRGLTHYYIDPSIETLYPYYNPTAEAKMSANGLETKPLRAAHLTFTGFGVKFFNLSPKPVLLYWDGREERKVVGEIAPFESLGTATTPGQSFSMTPVYDADQVVGRWVVTADDVTLYFEPMNDDQIQQLTQQERLLYQMQKLNQEFAKHYLIHSRRAWLSQFPRAFPLHPMWETSYIHQKHVYRDEGRDYHIRVESVLPKVLTIPDFLSDHECEALIQLALHEGLRASTVVAGSQRTMMRDVSTRSSDNTWLERGNNATSLTDAIYRRAARLLRLDERLFQKPVDDEVPAHRHSIAESLQVVRYRAGEEYTAHHDFVYPSQQLWYQPTRFATLLLYLNDDFEGGHTVFPRAVTRDLHDGVRIRPKKGTAVLFYSMLPDGNMDDRSQHASEPVQLGEKFIANLWVWEPLIN